MQTTQIVLASRPAGIPNAETFRTETIELPGPQEGELLLEPLYYSVDPYMRGRMNDAKSYAPPFPVNAPIEGRVVAKVIESHDNDFAAGDTVLGTLPWRTATVAAAKTVRKIDASAIPATYWLGVLGMPGLTAYFGLVDIGKPKAGETLVVSGAAGAVGIIVGQIGKIFGCRVIGIAGSNEKVGALKEQFGFDDAINYKTTPDIKRAIEELCPNGVDIYFDNVGGPISDAVIANINFHARIPLCGQISQYNRTEDELGPRLQPTLLTRSVLLQGFIISNYASRFAEGLQHLTNWVKEGKLKTTETFINGFDQLPAALLGLFTGENTGKMIVKA